MPPALKPIRVEPMTPEEFAPFGMVLSGSTLREPDFRDAGSTGWSYPLFVDGTPELIVVRTPYLGLRFSKLERHFHVSQAFVPLHGVRSAVVVSPPSGADHEAVPSPDSLRAFIVDETTGYVLHRGTWHSLDRYPLTPGYLDVVMLTEAETSEEVDLPDRELQRSQEVDFATTHNLIFEIVP